MSAFGGPNIGKETLDKLIFSFSPEENGVSQPTVIHNVSTFPLPKHSFNVTTSSLSPFYDPPTYVYDGWWGTGGRTPFEQTDAPNQTPSGRYTSFLNNNIAFTNFQYTVAGQINNNFLGDGVTVCGFINVDRFPIISTDLSANPNIKNKLGIIRFEYNRPPVGGPSFGSSSAGLGLFRVGARKANDSSKFAFGFHASFFSNLRLSIMTDYSYDINKWYFYSVHFRYSGPDTQTIDVYLTINGETVTTHTSPSFGFFNKKIVRNFKLGSGGTFKDATYPVNQNFLNSTNTTATGTRSYIHSIPLLTGFTTSYGGWRNNYNNIVQTNVLKNTETMSVSFLSLHKRSLGFAGLHDNIKLGQHFIINDYSTDVGKIYNSYKTLYL